MKLFLILQDEKHDEQESDEQIFLVGRHPHCHITRKHPSISRFHLRIHSNPSLRMVSVVDLVSGKIRQTLIYLLILHRLFVIEFVLIVNGTWVSGRRIEPGVRVVLKEGDTLKIGSGTVYKLHWVDEQFLFLPTVCTTKERDGEPFNADTEVEHSSPCKTGNGDVEPFSPSPLFLFRPHLLPQKVYLIMTMRTRIPMLVTFMRAVPLMTFLLIHL
jgi:hypothetical protein